MGSYKERLLRWVKTLFFLLSMLASLLLVCSPPLFVALLDILLPCALLSSASSSNPSLSNFRSYRFTSSLVDLPLVSVARSLLILCVYLIFEGRGPYLGITSLCSFGSIGYVSFKAAAMLGAEEMGKGGRQLLAVGMGLGGKDVVGARAVEGLFLSSLSLAMAHLVVAYKASCRARRKMIVYKIDIEAAVSTYNSKIALGK